MEKRAGAFWSEGQRLKGTWSDEEDDVTSEQQGILGALTVDMWLRGSFCQTPTWLSRTGRVLGRTQRTHHLWESARAWLSVDEWTGTTEKGVGSLASADSPGSPPPLSNCETWAQWVHYSLCRAPVLSQRVRAGVEKLTVKGHRCPSQMRNSAPVVCRQLWPVLVNKRGCAPVKLYLHRQGWASLCWPWFRIKDLWSLY